MNLLTFLTSSYVEQIDSNASQAEAEWSRHALDTMLGPEEGAGEMRAELLFSYLSLSVEDLDSLPVQTHEFFLEQLCHAPYAPAVENLSERIARLYFLSGTGLYRYLVLSALLTLDERSDTRVTHARPVWMFIANPQNFEGQDKPAMLMELADILLDLGQLTTNSRVADRALRQFWLDQIDLAEFRAAIERRVREEAERSGPEREMQLLSVIRY